MEEAPTALTIGWGLGKQRFPSGGEASASTIAEPARVPREKPACWLNENLLPLAAEEVEEASSRRLHGTVKGRPGTRASIALGGPPGLK